LPPPCLLPPPGDRRKIRTNHFTEITVDTFAGFDDDWWMVAFRIKLVGQFQNTFGAIFNAETAAFATLFQNMNIAFRNLKLL